jgi:hypothetical protein
MEKENQLPWRENRREQKRTEENRREQKRTEENRTEQNRNLYVFTFQMTF